MGTTKSRTITVRVSNVLYDKIMWVVDNENVKKNDLIIDAIERKLDGYKIPNLSVCEGQQELF